MNTHGEMLAGITPWWRIRGQPFVLAMTGQIRWHRTILTVVLLLLCSLGMGCKSKGPRFDPYATKLEAPVSEIRLSSAKLEQLNDRDFSAINNTNGIQRDWLIPPRDLLKLGPGDSIELEILGEANSGSIVVVGPDGKVYYSLLPGVFVWGLTLSETKVLLENELAKYIRTKPEMAVHLARVNSKRIWLLGNVQAPGVYPLATPVTLLEAVSLAGGLFEELSDLRNSFILRQGQLLRVDFYALFHKGDLSQNIYLQPDDFIYIRSSGLPAVYVLGAVRQPSMVEFGAQTSLAAVLAHAGGTLPYAHVSQIAVVRGSLTRPAISEVNGRAILLGKAPDIRLEPGDIVYVPFQPYRKIALLGEQILRQFVSTLALNEGYRSVIPNAQPIGIAVSSGGIIGGGNSGPNVISTPLPWQ